MLGCGDVSTVIVMFIFQCRDIQETQVKYLSEWDQWKRHSSKSWKRFTEKAREMAAHLELWRDDIRSIDGTCHALCRSLQCLGGKYSVVFTNLELKSNIAFRDEHGRRHS